MADRPKFSRRVLLINRQVQLKLVGYGVFTGICTATLTLLMQRMLEQCIRADGSLNWLILSIGLVSIVFLFSLVIILGLIVTNQIAGPLYRLQVNLQKIVKGEKASPIHGRTGDAYQELMRDYNALLEHLEKKSAGDRAQ